MRCVESGVQSGRYLAPMSRAFSLSSPLKGFWKPLRTNTTPSMIRLNGTCSTLLGFAFCSLGFGSGLDGLSRFLLADFCAGETGVGWGGVNQMKQTPRCRINLNAAVSVTFRCGGARRACWTRLRFGGHHFALGWGGWAHFLGGGRPGGGLPLFAELKFSFCWWLRGNNNKKKKISTYLCVGCWLLKTSMLHKLIVLCKQSNWKKCWETITAGNRMENRPHQDLCSVSAQLTCTLLTPEPELHVLKHRELMIINTVNVLSILLKDQHRGHKALGAQQHANMLQHGQRMWRTRPAHCAHYWPPDSNYVFTHS